MIKNQIRKEYQKIRDNLSVDERKEKSEIIMHTFFNTDFYKSAKCIMYYVSFKSEVETLEMIKNTLKEKIVVVPKVSGKELLLSRIENIDELVNGAWGILEPKEIKDIDSLIIDIIVVPGVVFDINCNRIGYGGGYYDRLLKKFKEYSKRPLFIGLAFDIQVIEEIIVDDYDICVDIIITEKRILERKEEN